MPNYYVRLFREWATTGPGMGQWVSVVAVEDVGGFLPQPGPTTIEIFRAQCPSRDAAVPTVMEWLARGRPRDMLVWTFAPIDV